MANTVPTTSFTWVTLLSFMTLTALPATLIATCADSPIPLIATVAAVGAVGSMWYAERRKLARAPAPPPHLPAADATQDVRWSALQPLLVRVAAADGGDGQLALAAVDAADRALALVRAIAEIEASRADDARLAKEFGAATRAEQALELAAREGLTQLAELTERVRALHALVALDGVARELASHHAVDAAIARLNAVVEVNGPPAPNRLAREPAAMRPVRAASVGA